MKKAKISRKKSRLVQGIEHSFGDLYHWLLVMNWWKFLGLWSLFYFAINVIFALAYLTTKKGIANAKPGSFRELN